MKLLKIDTILGKASDPPTNDDPLLLAELDGDEHISNPFRFEATLLRSEAQQQRHVLDPRKMIGTPCTFGILGEDSSGNERYVLRTGVFESFLASGFVAVDKKATRPDRMWKYLGVITSPLQFLGREMRFRIFESKTVVEVIKAVLDDMKARFPDLKFDLSALENQYFPKDYYVQFGESTFGFLNRLMARHGIFYYFGQTPGSTIFFDSPLNDTLVLGRDRRTGPSASPPLATEAVVTVLSDPPDQRFRSPEIHNVVHSYQPSWRQVKIGDHNTLAPTQTLPVSGTAESQPVYDFVSDAGEPGSLPDTFMKKVAFPVTLAPKTSDWPGGEPGPAEDYAETLVQEKEVAALMLTAASNNPFLIAGMPFLMVTKIGNGSGSAAGNDQSNGLFSKQFMVTSLHLHAIDNSYMTTTAQDVNLILDVIFAPFTNTIKFLGNMFEGVFSDIWDIFTLQFKKLGRDLGNQIGSIWNSIKQGIKDFFGYFADPKNVANTFAAQGLNNWLKTDMTYQFDVWFYPSDNPSNNPKAKPPTNPQHFWPYFMGGFFGDVSALLPYVYNPLEGVSSVFALNTTGFGTSVSAVPWADKFLLRPPAKGQKPQAPGPQLATVIGARGILPTTPPSDIYADHFGRVRIRFPWDPGPPLEPGAGASGGQTGDPWQTDLNTCWVRVSEGWAGRGFGTQFLPRIGQEVIVEFINGDPERPIIIGRVYNADTGPANLPFVPKEQIDNDYLVKPHIGDDRGRLSGLKTRSTPSYDADGKPKTPDRFHLLRFDDTRDKEQYLIRSQHRLDITAFEKRYETIHSDRHLTVGGKKLTPPPKEIGGDYLTKVFRHYHLHVGDPDFPTESGNRHTLIEQNDQLKVLRDANQIIGGNWSTAVGGLLAGQVTINAQGPSGIIVLNADQNISLTVGMSSIVITNSTIAITSPSVLINSGGPMPALPIKPEVERPTEPTNADPGDTLTTPE